MDFTKILNYLYLTRQKIFEIIPEILSFVYVRVYLIFIFFFNILSWVLAYFINSKAGQNPIIFLHYNVDFGANLVGDVGQLYTLSDLGLIVFIFNFFLFLNFYKKNKFISHLLLSAAVLVNAILVIALYLIYLVNFR